MPSSRRGKLPSRQRCPAISPPSQSPTTSTSREGNVIAQIDERDYRIVLVQAQAQVEAAQASIQNIKAQIVCRRRRSAPTKRKWIRRRRHWYSPATGGPISGSGAKRRGHHSERPAVASQLHQQQAALTSAQADTEARAAAN